MPDRVGHDGDEDGHDGDEDGRGSGRADRLGFPIEVRHDVNGLTTL